MQVKRPLTRSLLVCGVLIATLGLLDGAVVMKTDAQTAAYDEITIREIDGYVRRQMDRLHVPGASLAIVEGDEIVHMRGFGRARPGGEAVSPQTPFLIGSLTKSFTALAAMQLVEAGELDLDAPVQRHLPWFQVADPEASARITVRHLLNQTSGLPTASGWIPLADFDDSPGAVERQARELSEVSLGHPVGSAFEYSNANYNLLGLVIEAVSGESYADYVQSHIFIPLDMGRSTTSQAVAKQNGLAVGHRYWFWFPVAERDLPMPRGSLPSGQLISSSEDMAHYLIALLNEGRYGEAQILSGAGIAELQRGVAEHVAMGISMGTYGMGWYTGEIGGTKAVWHTGTVPEFASYMALLPEQKRGVVLLMNADHFMMEPALTEVGEGLTTLLAGRQPAPIRLGFIPWVMRGLLLIPLLQIAGVVLTVRRLRRWRRDPMSRPSGMGKWGRHILLPLIPNLLVTLTLLPMLGAMRGFWRLFTPDFSWIATVCGTFAGLWSLLRTGLVLRALEEPARSEPASRDVDSPGQPG